jgi:hypothetical protein
MQTRRRSRLSRPDDYSRRLLRVLEYVERRRNRRARRPLLAQLRPGAKY